MAGYDETIYVGVDDLVKIISNWALHKRELVVEKASFNISKEMCGMGDHKHECLSLKGVTLRCQPIDASPQSQVEK